MCPGLLLCEQVCWCMLKIRFGVTFKDWRGVNSLLAGRYVMDDAGRDALVLLDELGKGTEVAAGTALAAAFLERLERSGCRGIFATCALVSSTLIRPPESFSEQVSLTEPWTQRPKCCFLTVEL